MDIKPHNIVFDDHLNTKNIYICMVQKRKILIIITKLFIKFLKLNFNNRKKQTHPGNVVSTKLSDNNIEKGINIYQTLNQYLIKDGQIIVGEKIIIEIKYLAI